MANVSFGDQHPVNPKSETGIAEHALKAILDRQLHPKDKATLVGIETPGGLHPEDKDAGLLLQNPKAKAWFTVTGPHGELRPPLEISSAEVEAQLARGAASHALPGGGVERLPPGPLGAAAAAASKVEELLNPGERHNREIHEKLPSPFPNGFPNNPGFPPIGILKQLIPQ